MTQVHFVLHSLEDTERMARVLVRHLTLPDVIALEGNLGAGKTTVAQALGRAFGVTEFLPSPTFTLVNEYRLPDVRYLVHADFYRLESKEELLGLGLNEYFTQPKTLTIVEWADRFPHYFPSNTIWLKFHHTDDHRSVRCSSPQLWRKLSQELHT